MSRYGIDIEELNRAMWDFDNYMTSDRWDASCNGEVYADDGMRVVGCFLEFIDKGFVTDDNLDEV